MTNYAQVRYRSAALLLAVVCLPCQELRAQDRSTPGPAASNNTDPVPAKEQARPFFLEAEAHKREGDKADERGDKEAAYVAYGKAAELYYKANAIWEHPNFVFNLAQMRRKRGECVRAIRAYRSYEDQAGADAETIEKAKSYIKELTLELEKEPLGSSEVCRDNDPRPVPPPPKPPGGDDTPIGSDNDGRVLRWSGIAVSGVGLVALGMAGYFGYRATDASNQISDKPVDDPWTGRDRKLISDGEAHERNMIIATSVGGAALVVGGILYYVGYRGGQAESRAAPLAVTPQVNRGTAVLTILGRF